MKWLRIFILSSALVAGSSSFGGLWTALGPDSNWGTVANWSNSSVVDGSDQSAEFRTAGENVTLVQERTVLHLYHNNVETVPSRIFEGAALNVYGNLSNFSLNTSSMVFSNQVNLFYSSSYRIQVQNSGSLELAGGLSLINQGVYFNQSGTGSIMVSGDIAAGLQEVRVEAGLLYLTGAGTWSGGSKLLVKGSLILARTGGSEVSADLIQIDGGTIRIDRDEQLVDTENIGFLSAGSVLDLNGHTETIKGFATLSGVSGTIDMGVSGILNLANQNSNDTLDGLVFSGWVDGKSFVYMLGGSFSAEQLSKIHFDGYAAGAVLVVNELRPANTASVGGAWIGSGGGDSWGDAGNWSGGNIADGYAGNAVFAAGGQKVVLGQRRSVKHLFHDEISDAADHYFSGSTLNVYGNLSNFSQNTSSMVFSNSINWYYSHYYRVQTKNAGSLELAGGFSLVDQGVYFNQAGTGSITVSGDLDAGNKTVVVEAGMVSFSGGGIWSGGSNLVVNGMLVAARSTTNSTAIDVELIQLAGGTLLLGNDEQVANERNILFWSAGGLFDLDGYSETVKGLSTKGGVLGHLAMGDHGILNLSEQDYQEVLDGLLIHEWDDGEDFIHLLGGSFSYEQLQNIVFDGYAPGAIVVGTELRPAPEGSVAVPHKDLDQDGMLDSWEFDYFGSMMRDGTDDYDGDTESDLMEYNNFTDPSDAANVAVESNAMHVAQWHLLRSDGSLGSFCAELRWNEEGLLTNGIVVLPGGESWTVPALSNGIARSAEQFSVAGLKGAGFSNGVYAATFQLVDGRTIRHKYTVPDFVEADFPDWISVLSPAADALGFSVFAPLEFPGSGFPDGVYYNGNSAEDLLSQAGENISLTPPAPLLYQSSYVLEVRHLLPGIKKLGSYRPVPFSTISAPGGKDDDFDGISDYWETDVYGGDAAPDEDTDGDGMSNWEEYIADLLPKDSNSVLRITALNPQNDGLWIHWKNGGSNAVVQLLYKPSLLEGEWGVIESMDQPSATENSYQHSNTNQNGFYSLQSFRP